MYRALRYIGPVGLGATSPQLFRAENDCGDVKVCVVKLSTNRLGTKVLVNELLAAQFGEWLKLCFPPGGLIHLSPELLKGSRRLTAAAVPSGWHFGCEYLQGVRYVDKYDLHRVVNKEQMAGVMLFDHLFHNPDRTENRKNLLIRRERSGYKLYAIDNSHLFRRGKWTINKLKELVDTITINHRRSYGVLLKYYLKPEQLFNYAAAVKAIGDDKLARFMDGIPEEWLPDGTERQALHEFLLARRDKADWVAEKLSRLIPNVHQGSDMD
ncbi:HipA family kinase [Sporomusa acidovorans]|uniref:HipA-like kinase domain-containing protein n=1 Tax=Sporomusa acidovorans (strain ATCC 49682 / DSM 3132 / Mol) TaxID=1123286 RepID=A0ABZ3IW22_SPOA4|nr:HipA family kinase [Sporomusa acidovorans]OZC14017.1 hypothetical protein SPACI_54490 [Sporomusa acidovorans DSM 3132]SDF22525.1 hypothetical protein SAMN04488499_103851 [Sporomusa acidovorans]